MNKRIVRGIIALGFCLLIFSSCSNVGFPVKKGYVQLPLDKSISLSNEYKKDVIEFPLDIYKLYEKKLKEIAKVFNKFQGASKDVNEIIQDVRSDIGSLYLISWIWNDDDQDVLVLREGLKGLGASKKQIDSIIEFAKNAETENELDICYGISRFASEVESNLYFVKYGMEEASRFVNGRSFYNSMEEIFNAYVLADDAKESFAFLKKYFPKVEFVTKYEDTEYAKSKK